MSRDKVENSQNEDNSTGEFGACPNIPLHSLTPLPLLRYYELVSRTTSLISPSCLYLYLPPGSPIAVAKDVY